MVDGVPRGFRRRLGVADALAFADVPPLVRALFVADWDLEEPRRAFGDRAAMTAEVHERAGPGTRAAPARRRRVLGGPSARR